jgi:membrane protease YdiL (CAAX protease family)
MHIGAMETNIVVRRSVLPLVLGLAVAFSAMRMAGMLGPASLRWMVPLGFVLMALAPWALLDREGRRAIGLCAARGLRVIPAALAGAVAALACGALGVLLFGSGPDNWFVSVATYYRGTVDTSALGKVTLYWIFTTPALIFSPIGEEIFFRGLLQRALEEKLSVRAATWVECAAFGLVHLCHHGLALSAAGEGGVGLSVQPLSAALWVVLMFLVALMFAQIRKRSGSLYPAMAAHAAFNAAMNAVIFGYLWPNPTA